MGTEVVKGKTAIRAATGLRLAGASYQEIAEVLQYESAISARSAVMADLAKLGDDVDRAQLRDIEGERLLRLLRGVWTKATSPNDPEHLAAIRAALQIIERRAKLFGLDAPQEVIVYNPTMHEIEAWVNDIISKSSDDIIEGEVVV